MQNEVHVRSNVLQMGIAIKYEYPKGKWRPTLAAGVVAIYMPDGSIKEVTDIFSYDRVRSSTVKMDIPTLFMHGFGFIPGIHYYLAKEQIIFMQVQYLHCLHAGYYIFQDKYGYRNFRTNVIRSFGLSAGIYF